MGGSSAPPVCKDDCTRECPAIAVDFALPGSRVVAMLEDVARERGCPDMLVVDNGPELRGRDLDRWAYENGVKLFFIDPGKPMQNGSIESFNGRFRDECLDPSWFTSLAEARRVIEAWRVDYNQHRPHTSLRMATPARPSPKPDRSSGGNGLRLLSNMRAHRPTPLPPLPRRCYPMPTDSPNAWPYEWGWVSRPCRRSRSCRGRCRTQGCAAPRRPRRSRTCRPSPPPAPRPGPQRTSTR